jgi:hypothetical protein
MRLRTQSLSAETASRAKIEREGAGAPAGEEVPRRGDEEAGGVIKGVDGSADRLDLQPGLPRAETDLSLTEFSGSVSVSGEPGAAGDGGCGVVRHGRRADAQY